MRVLVVNAGSSSLKVDVVDGGRTVASYDSPPHDPPEMDAVGHRIVHGGSEFAEPVIVDSAIEERLRKLAELAPLHQPKLLAGLARRWLPDVPHVACFDTAFRTTLAPAAYTYALPRNWRERWDIRRYGFHGLSHAWASRRAQQMAPGVRRVVTRHLGAGASLAAVLDGRSVDTTMGFTPLDGLVMATRSGSVDPGLITWLEQHECLAPNEVAYSLEHESGLLALSGTADMRALLQRHDADAELAIGVYVHRLAGSIAEMTVALGGLDAVVFTGGVGEHAAEIRSRASACLGHLGVRIDEDRNAFPPPDTDINLSDVRVRVLVVASREDLKIAAGAEQLLANAR